MLSIWEKRSFTEFDVIIIGGGILGLSTAISLKELDESLDILILERGAIPSGASTKNAGFACFGSLTEILADIRRIGKGATAALVEKRWLGIRMLRERLGDGNMGLLNYGGYELISKEKAHLAERADMLNDMLRDVFEGDAFVPADERTAEFGFSTEAAGALIFSPYESQIDTGLMMRSLMKLAHLKGVVTVNNYEAAICDSAPGRITVSSGNSPVRFACKALASCSNAFTSVLIPEMKVKPGRGQVISTAPVSGLPFRGVFHMDEGFYYFRNYGDRVILGGGRNLDFSGEETYLFGNTELITNELFRLLREVILPGREFSVEMMWSGLMGFNDTKLPSVMRTQDGICAGFCCNGMGVALASVTGKELALLIAEA